MIPITDDAGQCMSIRPLVRYVDREQAVIDIRVTLHRPNDIDNTQAIDPQLPLEVFVGIKGPGGYVYEHQAHLDLQDRTGMVRFEMGDPQRWWPTGMGAQPLYDLSVVVLFEDDILDQWASTIGLTSVRPMTKRISLTHETPQSMMGLPLDEQAILLINGQECSIHTVVPVDPPDEHQVLPVGQHCLLVVRGHYGPDELYNAADRAGTLLVQSIPPAADADTAQDIRTQIDRLAGHPSLAGWLVERTDTSGDRLAAHVHDLDPTRGVLRYQ